MSEESKRGFTYKEVERIHAAYESLPVKGEGIIKSAMNIVALQSFVDTVTKGRKLVFDQFIFPGAVQITPDHPEYEKVIRELDALNSKGVGEMPILEKIKKSELRLVDTTPQGVQSGIALLVFHGLLEMKE